MMAPRATKTSKTPDADKLRLKAQRERRRQEAMDQFLRGSDGLVDPAKVAKVLKIISDGAAKEREEEALIAKAVEGRWQFTGMPDFNEPVPAYIEFGKGGRGKFRFIDECRAIRAKFSRRRSLPYVAFTWGGRKEKDKFCGRGHAKIWPDGTMIGRFWIHEGNDHVFGAEKVKATKKKTRLAVDLRPARRQLHRQR